jgi:hypothetical protein
MAVVIEEVVRVAELIRSVDDSRLPADPFKLPAALRSAIETEYVALNALGGSQVLTEGERARNSQRYQAAIDDLKERLKEGFRHIQSRPDYELDAASRLGAFNAYGWTGGKMGLLQRDDRVLALGQQAITASASLQPEVARYPEELRNRIQSLLDVINSTRPLATVGRRQSLTQQRNEAAKTLWISLSRARFHYCAASTLLDKTPELARIGFQPRRVSGQRLLPSEPGGGIIPPSG